MMRFHASETLSAEVVAALRRRVIARRWLVVLVVLFVAVVLAAAMGVPRPPNQLAVLAAGLWLVAFLEDMALLFGPCARCGQRFSEPSILNLFIAPSPSAFDSSCARCGVPLSRAILPRRRAER